MKQRVLTAAVAGSIFLLFVFWGGLPFFFLIYFMAAIAFEEILRMKKIPALSPAAVIGMILLFLYLVPPEYAEAYLHIDDSVRWSLIGFGALILLSVPVFTNNRFSFDEAGVVSLAVLYLGFGFSHMIAVRLSGMLHFFFPLFLVWATDSGAYFTGRAIGKRKLAPKISPNKTVEGFFGGIAGGLLVSILFSLTTGIGETFHLPELLFLSILLSVFGQLGDLAESALKRHYGVKDSGKLLPGHGGILDRVDSWLFVMPLFDFFLS